MLGSIFCVLTVEICERLGFYSLKTNLKVFLELECGYSNSSAISQQGAWGFWSYATCIFGGWLADTPFGRFKTILSLSFVYAVGCALIALSVSPLFSSSNIPLFLFALWVPVALGTGGIKPNVVSFGADQIPSDHPDATSIRTAYMLYFYLCINLGAILASVGPTQWVQFGIPALGISKDHGYFCAFSLCAISMIVSTSIFGLGTPLYRKESFQTNSVPVASILFQNRFKGGGGLGGLSFALIPPWFVCMMFAAFGVAADYTVKISEAMSVILVILMTLGNRNNDHMDDPDAAKFFNVIPVILTGNLATGTLLGMTGGIFLDFGCNMNAMVPIPTVNGWTSTQVAPTSLSIFNQAAIISFTPLIERVIFPAYVKATGKAPPFQCLIGTAITIGTIALLWLMVIFYWITTSGHEDPPTSTCTTKTADEVPLPNSEVSMLYVGISYYLVGCAEIFSNPILQGFAYENFPSSMKSMGMATNMLYMGGFGEAFAGILNKALERYKPQHTAIFAPEMQMFTYLGLTTVSIVLCYPMFLFAFMPWAKKTMSQDIVPDFKASTITMRGM